MTRTWSIRCPRGHNVQIELPNWVSNRRRTYRGKIICKPAGSTYSLCHGSEYSSCPDRCFYLISRRGGRDVTVMSRQDWLDLMEDRF